MIPEPWQEVKCYRCPVSSEAEHFEVSCSLNRDQLWIAMLVTVYCKRSFHDKIWGMHSSSYSQKLSNWNFPEVPIASQLGLGVCVQDPPSILALWLGLAQVLQILLWPLWVDLHSCTAMFSWHCFLVVIHSLWLLYSLCSWFFDDRW